MRTTAEEELRVTLRALECADAPLDPSGWPVLADPDSRAEIARRLTAAGRQLVAVRATGGDGAATGYVTTWDDNVAADLLTAGCQPLSTVDRAVLALVLLHSVIIPQAAGMLAPHGFTSGLPVDATALRKPGEDGHGIDVAGIEDALKRLRARSIITRDNRPGAAFARLSPAQQTRLWRNLFRFARPSWAAAMPASTSTPGEDLR